MILLSMICTPKRAQIMDDALNLAKSGLLDYEVMLTILKPILTFRPDCAEPDLLPVQGDGLHPLVRRPLWPLLRQQDAQEDLSLWRL